MKVYCLYQHITADTDEVFYVGIGTESRPYKTTSRNKYWHNIANKHGYRVEVVKWFSNWSEACDWESLFISLYGKRVNETGCLVNITDGGQGVSGLKMSDLSRKKISDGHKGSKNYWYGKTQPTSHRQKLSRLMSEIQANNKHRKPLKVMCVETGRVWESRKVAAVELGIKDTTLKSRMSIPNSKRTTLRYLR